MSLRISLSGGLMLGLLLFFGFFMFFVVLFGFLINLFGYFRSGTLVRVFDGFADNSLLGTWFKVLSNLLNHLLTQVLLHVDHFGVKRHICFLDSFLVVALALRHVYFLLFQVGADCAEVLVGALQFRRFALARARGWASSSFAGIIFFRTISPTLHALVKLIFEGTGLCGLARIVL